MERSYFIFYGFAIACCINMLFAGQVENYINSSLTVQNPTVALNCFYETCSFDLKADEYSKYSEKDKVPAVINVSMEMEELFADLREIQDSLCGNVEIIKQHKPDSYYVEDPKRLGGFDFIIEFPDKLS
ncbi:hypothetical protein [Chryseobacterium shigense]|uniref:Uncharacterized protein n=1 Tax=Chryseobacterium shigense TaxID=297244 RepID=A0A841NN66_9FLAO|nr:hypothetical protein [Chryseobacterium shigense]MBB6372175.1 hypothetical protein [Chryseobacterium shigense]